MRPVLAALAATALLVTPTHATEPTLAGDLCRFLWMSQQDATFEQYWVGEVQGGPLAAATLPTLVPTAYADLVANPVQVTLTCTVRTTDSGTVTHTSPAVASASGSGPAVAVVAPTPFTAFLPDYQPMAVCAEVGTTDAYGQTRHWYYDGVRLETDPAVGCGYVPPCMGGCDPPDPWSLVDQANELIAEHVDPVVCPYLAQAFPPDGDVEALWACPPY